VSVAKLCFEVHSHSDGFTSFAGPISKLLEHLRTKDQCNLNDLGPNTLDAFAGGTELAEKATQALSISAGIEDAAGNEALPTRRGTTGMLDLENKRLEALPDAVWRAGMHTFIHPCIASCHQSTASMVLTAFDDSCPTESCSKSGEFRLRALDLIVCLC
jgi:hypothetical protein